MPSPTTESLPNHEAVDTLPAPGAASFMLDSQLAALASVRDAISDIVRAAEVMADAIRSGNRLIYAAAGSSGLMALADACEIPGTFGVPSRAIRIHMAGGIPSDGHMPGATEDDEDSALRVAGDVQTGDAVILLSASGTTPYALAVARSARAKGGTVIGIANNPGSKLLDMADISICLATPAEVIAGSTRLGAGTAQKAALNMVSSLMGIMLGHVHDGQMVNVVADNAKLVKRAAGMVARISNVSGADAEGALHHTRGDIKAAILVARGCTPEAAKELLKTHDGQLKRCLQSLTTT
ncbi:N-acetylmuramic acid 6-phosphate etherase [Roseobacter sp. YSTF-M11]|uniref:N-acetylmuramic acid 6-phosphate etherase n=1 Tax=Roseobacter insulae TaxID=2859783 RepID=A0A9X1K1Z0_9RHOB|nr:N-acetylmuramic acid 6-phosphate etherase [Roseobacter insulae]MBW4707022.1 N-acetylmuramic acid 6-phosphate etherase [Roseobacter insulae]